MVSPFVIRIPIVKESPHGTPLTSMSYCVAEYLVYLLFGWHPPVWVGSAMHPNELCRKTCMDKKQLVFVELAIAQVSKADGKQERGITALLKQE